MIEFVDDYKDSGDMYEDADVFNNTYEKSFEEQKELSIELENILRDIGGDDGE